MSELPSSEDLDPSTGTDAPTPPTTTGPSSYTLNWEEPVYSGEGRLATAPNIPGDDPEATRTEAFAIGRWAHNFAQFLRDSEQ